MSGLEVNLEYIEQQTIYGLWQKSNDKTISRDIKDVYKRQIEKLLLQNFKNCIYTLSAYLMVQLGKNFADVVLFMALVALLTALVA